MRLLISIFCLCIALISEAQLLTFKNINHKNGLNLSSVLSITQDKSGYIWIGTDGFGLQQYDGKIVKSVSMDDNEHHVTSIDPVEKNIYFSSLYKGFFKLNDDKLSEIVPGQNDFGERLAIKTIGKSILLIGKKKMKLCQNGKVIRQVHFSPYMNNIVQLLKISNAIILITDEKSYYISETKILELNKWLNLDIKPIACRFYDNKIEFFEQKKASKTIVYLNKDGSIFSKELKNNTEQFNFSFAKVFSREKTIFALADNEEIYYFKDNAFKIIPKNTVERKFNFASLFIDHNNDFWATSTNSGIYKISDEPFTKIELDEVYRNPLISFISKNQKNEVLISTFENKTFYGSFSSQKFQKYDLRINSKTTYKGQEIYATSKGLMTFNKGIFSPFKSIRSVKNTIFVFANGDEIFFSIPTEGLFRYNSKDSKTTLLVPTKRVSHAYTAQSNFNRTKIYFGTNNGIYEYHVPTGKIKIISGRFKTGGSYSGISCTDSYGTMWFTFDSKIVGITKREEYLVITDKKYFKSRVFYTLNADPYGNLIIGTNVGITKLKIDHVGNVISNFEYNYNNGFNGFETHMRSCFQDGKMIYVGTIEGMFSINTEKLEYLPNPPKPIVFQLKEKKNSSFNSDEELIKLSYLVLNPKLTGIQYTYRLKGKTKYWSEVTPKTEAYFSNLSDQEYIFQVRSTYDGMNFSEIANYKIIKNTPFWKTKWFILFLVLSIALANIIVLDRSKNFEISQVIESHDIEINSRIRNIILVFALIFNTGTHYFAYFIERKLNSSITLNTIGGIILICLIFLSVFKHPFFKIKKYLLQIALFVVVGQAYISAYISSLHPFHVVVISLCTALTPFILNRVSQVIIFSIFQIIAVVSIVFLVEYPIYNQFLFVIAIIISISFSVFTTYIRNESLQKLIFVSDIINKGNILAIAFDQNNKITYSSNNIVSLLNIYSIPGNNISDLNKYVNQRLSKRKIDFTIEFQDDKSHIIPMKKINGDDAWIEWHCKVFSNKVKVIFGQDITERVKVENTYESLVDNAQDLIYYLDVNGVFIYSNNKFQEVLGYKENELIGRESLFMVNEKQQEDLRLFYLNQFKSKTLNTYKEVLIRRKDGSEIWIGQNTTILYAFGSTKTVKGFLCIGRDITGKRAQQDLIEVQNQYLKTNLNYAKKIQKNLLPSQEKLAECFKEHAVLSEAKDQVSGDFYWCVKRKNKTVFVLADCASHDISGAFISLLVNHLLSAIIIDEQHLDPATILRILDERFTHILSKESNSDLLNTIEISVFVHDKKTNSYEYACAGGKFIVQDKEEFTVCQGESKQIGTSLESNFTQYNTYTLEEKKYDAFYFFTDGIQEQISDSTFQKFSLKRLIEILKSQPQASMEEQVSTVKSKHEKWKGRAEQTDDITFIGFRV